MTANETTEKMEPKPKVKEPNLKARLILFVVTYPNDKGKSVDFLEELEKSYTVLHPSFDYEGEAGLKIRMLLPEKNVPWENKIWKRIPTRDYWGIKQSDVVVYDVDSNPGEHFITAAFLQHKPVIGVSETLRGIQPYFSSCVESVVHPEGLIKAIGLLQKHE